MSILPKTIYRFNTIPIKLPMVFSTELEQIISQFVWKHKKTQIAKAILRKKNGTEVSTFLTSDYMTKLQSSREHGTGKRQKNRSTKQNRKPRDKSLHLWTPYLWQRRQNTQWRNDSLFNKWCWENWLPMCKRMELEHFYHHTQK